MFDIQESYAFNVSPNKITVSRSKDFVKDKKDYMRR